MSLTLIRKKYDNLENSDLSQNNVKPINSLPIITADSSFVQLSMSRYREFVDLATAGPRSDKRIILIHPGSTGL